MAKLLSTDDLDKRSFEQLVYYKTMAIRKLLTLKDIENPGRQIIKG
jgi:hypothetical protein